MLTTYWDLTERERSALSSEDVQRYVDAELMTKGVLRVKPLELLPVPEMPDPDVTVYVIKAGYHSSELAYATAEKCAEAASQSFATVGGSYIGGEHIARLDRQTETPAVEPKRVYSPEMIAMCRENIERSIAAKAENSKREKEYAAQTKAVAEALSGLWADWHECCGTAVRMQRIVDTLAEYQRIAGDEAVAMRFLLKVFTREEINAAEVWFMRAFPPLPPATEGEAATPKKTISEVADEAREIPF